MRNGIKEPVCITQKFTMSYEYPVLFCREVFDRQNYTLSKLIDNLAESPCVLPIIDRGVAALRPELKETICDYFAHHGITALSPVVLEGGEACKNDETLLESLYSAVEEHRIDRHSYFLVIGGGALIDAVGYAAATAHRGVRLIRMPSTVLAQNDAGVGVKNAINFHNRKNFVGTFAPPFAVVNDFSLLKTLSSRDKRAGIAEAVKVALIKDPAFFSELYELRHALAAFEQNATEKMIIECAKWHLDHIANSGDPFELGSARPLDFGHWSAHKLEQMTNNALRHGEAVAIGIALDTIYSALAQHITVEQADQVIELLLDLGFELNHPVLTDLDIIQALNEFKEHLGGDLCITLLSDIGKGFEVHEIDDALMLDAINQIKAL
ncbi:3-dehydroquinate synthase [Agaribacter flavus]|uniref:3-dehydroquinate synthase n=1 Tax=Agaribacter flavus TaxID=1902781 RepID=A0ABV7FS98_9ALTE